jgi:integrase
MTILDNDEESILISGFDGHWLQPLVLVALTTGARAGELLALQWQDIDFKGRRMSIS